MSKPDRICALAICILLIAISIMTWPATAKAHRPSQAFVTIGAGDDAQHRLIQWDVALRDLDMVLDLDTNLDGVLTFGEIDQKQGEAWRYLLAHLTLQTGGSSDCANRVPVDSTGRQSATSLVRRSDGAYLRLQFQAFCRDLADRDSNLQLAYGLFEEFDPHHRAVVRVDGTLNVVPTGAREPLRADAGTDSASQASGVSTMMAFFGSGFYHILIGLDHLAFLVALMIGSLLASQRQAQRNGLTSATDLWIHLRRLLVTVTAFTLAHSITLSLAATGYLNLPSGPVEIVIALSIIIAALANLKSHALITGPKLAFAFGLVHGLGFATVMAGAGGNDAATLWGLAGFNLGVEAGQLTFIVLVYPMLGGLCRILRSPRLVAVSASIALVILGSVWVLERIRDEIAI